MIASGWGSDAARLPWGTTHRQDLAQEGVVPLMVQNCTPRPALILAGLARCSVNARRGLGVVVVVAAEHARPREPNPLAAMIGCDHRGYAFGIARASSMRSMRRWWSVRITRSMRSR